MQLAHTFERQQTVFGLIRVLESSTDVPSGWLSRATSKLAYSGTSTLCGLLQAAQEAAASSRPAQLDRQLAELHSQLQATAARAERVRRARRTSKQQARGSA